MAIQSLSVKIVREYLVLEELYGDTPNLNMEKSSMLVISVTIKLHDQII